MCFQMSLLEMNWKELFVISLLEWSLPINLIYEKDLIKIFHQNIKNPSQRQLKMFIENFKNFKDKFCKLLNISIDITEYHFLKAFIMFKNGNILTFD